MKSAFGNRSIFSKLETSARGRRTLDARRSVRDLPRATVARRVACPLLLKARRFSRGREQSNTAQATGTGHEARAVEESERPKRSPSSFLERRHRSSFLVSRAARSVDATARIGSRSIFQTLRTLEGLPHKHTLRSFQNHPPDPSSLHPPPPQTRYPSP